jgi:membrane protease YdiL (CAAX protease family)
MGVLEPVGHGAPDASRPDPALADPAPVPLPPAGWYPDPWRVEPWRWWDGNQWTGYAGASGAPVGAFPISTVPVRGWFPKRKPRDTEGGLKGGGLAIAGFVGGIALSIALALAAIALGADRGSTTVLVVSEVGLWSALIGACLIAVRRHGSGSLKDLGLTWPRWRDAGVGSVAGLVGRIATIIVVIPLVPLIEHQHVTKSTTTVNSGLNGNTLSIILTVGIIVLGAPIVEELFFRGLVQGALTRRFGAWAAVWIQAACFAAAHFQVTMTAVQVLVTVLSIFVMGLILGVVRWRYQRLAPGMFAHATFNLIAVLLFFAIT